MGEDDGRAAPPIRPPASALMTIGIMATVAIVAVTAIVGWARFFAAGARNDGTDEARVPTTLLGGLDPAEVPPAVVAAVEEPVVGAKVLGEPPEGVGCDMGWELRNAHFEGLTVTTEAAVASWTGDGEHAIEFRAEPMPMPAPVPGEVLIDPPMPPPMPPEEFIKHGPSRMHVWCELQWQDGRWVQSGGGGVTEGESTGGMGFTCCDRDGFGTAQASAAVPEGASYLLQERDGWWLAYPVAGRRVAWLTWKAQQGRFGIEPGHILFVNDDGDVIDERFLNV